MAAYDLFYTGDFGQGDGGVLQGKRRLLHRKGFCRLPTDLEKPVHTRFKGYDVYSNNSPSRGGIQTVMILNLLETYDLKKMGHNMRRIPASSGRSDQARQCRCL